MRYALSTPTFSIEDRRNISVLINTGRNDILESMPSVERAPGKVGQDYFCVYCNHSVGWGYIHGGWSRFYHRQKGISRTECEAIARILEIPTPMRGDY